MIVALAVVLFTSGCAAKRDNARETSGTQARTVAVRADRVLALPSGHTLIGGVSESRRGGEGTRACDGELAVVRLDARGRLDAAFGDRGFVHVRPEAKHCVSSVNQVVPEPDGHTLIGMTIFRPSDSGMEDNSSQRANVKRLTSSGQVVGAFEAELSGFRFAASPDGSIFDEAGARYRPDGVRDGELAGVSVDLAVDVAVQDDGRKLFLGLKHRTNHRRIAVQRLDPRWQADTTFGNDGVATADVAPGKPLEPMLQPSPERVLPAPGGAAIVFARAYGPKRTYASAIKFDASGRLDRTFGDHGRVELGPPSRTTEVYDLTVQQDGSLVAIGSSAAPGGRRFFVARHRPDGRPDRRFGEAGRVALDLPPGARGVGHRRLDDGARVGAITAATGGGYVGIATAARAAPKSLVFRLRPDGSLDPSFGQGGMKLLPLRRQG